MSINLDKRKYVLYNEDKKIYICQRRWRMFYPKNIKHLYTNNILDAQIYSNKKHAENYRIEIMGFLNIAFGSGIYDKSRKTHTYKYAKENINFLLPLKNLIFKVKEV